MMININSINVKTLQSLLFLLLLAGYNNTSAQCNWACNGNVNVTLDNSCAGEITPEMMLAGTAVTDCAGPFMVIVMDTDGTALGSSPFVSADQIDQTLEVKVINQDTGLPCWGNILIEDKTDPEIVDCGPISVPCDADTDPVFTAPGADPLAYAPTVTDNCGATLTYTDAEDLGGCSEGFTRVINRSWTATDGSGNTAVCVQVITVELPDVANIIAPSNFDNIDLPALQCDEKETASSSSCGAIVGWNAIDAGDFSGDHYVGNPSPDDVLYPCGTVKWQGTGYPTGAASCAQVFYTFQDERINICAQGSSEGCYKILRHWFIMDWCTGIIEEPLQIIKVEDVDGPTISDIVDVTVSTDVWSCEATYYAPVPWLEDNCSTITDYTVSASGGTVSFSDVLNQYIITDLGLGTYQITYSASDCCGNNSDLTIDLTVQDLVPPVAVCEVDHTVTLSTDGTAKVFANTFDDGSHDNCVDPVFFKVIRMDDMLGTDHGSHANQTATDCDVANGDDNALRNGNQIYFDDFAKFCCEDVMNDDLMVVFRVFDVDPGAGPVDPDRMLEGGDLYRHWNECMVDIEVEDKLPPVIVCPADVTLDCTQDFTDLTLTNGEATATDDCGIVTITHTDSDATNQCGVGVVTRIWTATDMNGKTASCIQRITLEDNTIPVVEFPDDITLNCGEGDDFEIAGRPTVEDDCSLFGFFNDDEIHYVNDSCSRKIIRIWKVMDICNHVEYSDVQIIIEYDTEGPVFSNYQADITIECDDLASLTDPTVSDLCTFQVDLEKVETTTPGDCVDSYTINRTYTATDRCGNSTTATQSIFVDDTTPPVVTVDDPVLNLSCTDAIPAISFSTTDNCDDTPTTNVSEVSTPGACTDEYTITRTVTATDNCGNVGTGTQVINVTDNADPVLAGIPANTTINCDETPAAANVTATDDCDNDVDIDLASSTTPGDCLGESTITRTWTATDNCGNTSVATQIVTVIDNTAPELVGVPANTSIQCDESPSIANVTGTDNCDVDVEVTMASSIVPGDCPGNSTITRTWTATDDCGNTATASQVITVTDDTPPTLANVPANTSAECDMIPAAGMPTATDNCDNDVMISMSETSAPGDCEDAMSITRVWTATDHCGNTATASQVIAIDDTTPPEIANVPDDVTIECSDPPVVMLPTATDNCDTDVVITEMQMGDGGPCTGSTVITRVFTATDNCGNTSTATQQVTLNDEEPPTLTGVPDDLTVDCNNIPDLPVVTASDDCTPNIMPVMSGGTEAGNCPDNFVITRIWTATDLCGNSVSQSQVITVRDDAPPVLAGIPDNVTLECDMTPADAVVTATDNCTDDPNVSMAEMMTPGDCPNNFTLTRTWTATDNCGNTATASQVITIDDTTAPVLSGAPMDMTIECSVIPDPDVLTATDNCTDPQDVVFSETRVDGDCPEDFVLTRTWTATDDCGNATSVMQVLTFQDDDAPVLSDDPDDITVECVDIPSITDITAMDNCNSPQDVEFNEVRTDGDCPHNYTLTRTWTATDNCGNATSAMQVISVDDNTPPVISGIPDDLTVECSDVPDPSGVDISDNCSSSVNIDVVFAEMRTDGNCTDNYTLMRTWTATDECSNVSTATQMLTVQDTQIPTFTGVGDDVTVECGMIPDPDDVQAMDNCDTDVFMVFLENIEEGDCVDERIITRTWTASDNCGNTNMAQQIITVEDNTPPVITIMNATVTASCDDIPDFMDGDATATDNCDDDVELTFTTANMNIICEDGFQIVRTYTATDNCGNTATASQSITVTDSQPPVINCSNDITVGIFIELDPFGFPIHRCDSLLAIPVSAMDNCDEDVSITNDSEFAFSNDGDADGRYPLGVHVITFTATDNCGNETTCSTTVTVNDAADPTFLCGSQTIFLDAATMEATINATDFIFLIIDCTPNDEVITQFLPPFTGNSQVLTCADLGDQFIGIQLTDNYGNTSTCGIGLTVQEPDEDMDGMPDDICPTPPMANVAGIIESVEGERMENIEVDLDGGMDMTEMTSVEGIFNFPQLPTNYNYVVEPFHDEDHLNGVSTFDLVLISKHILNIEQLDSPYKMLAADVNNSGSITTLDLVDLRKLILYINEDFPNNNSWRFIDKDFVFPQLDNPFATAFPESYSINGLEHHMGDVDFVGVKIGDVNGTATVNSTQQPIAQTRSSNLILMTEEQTLAKDQLFTVEVTAKDFNALLGYQFTFDFDASMMSFVDLEATKLSEKLGLSTSSFGLSHKDAGKITTAWYNNQAIDLKKEEVLFSLKFKAQSEFLLSKAIRINSSLTKAEAYNNDGEFKDVVLEFGQENSDYLASEFQLFQNRPNPFVDETVIGFMLPKASAAKLSIFDFSGRLIKSIDQEFDKGYNELDINIGDLGGPGVYYYELESDEYQATRKMILHTGE